MGDELSSALPASYFLSLVSAHPTPILLPLFLIYELYISLTSHLSYAKSLSVYFWGGMYHSASVNFKIDADNK